jgi:hypothetical protein
MKIKQEDYQKLENIINTEAERCGGMDHIKSLYEHGQFPRADRVKDLQKRFVWDMLFSAKRYNFINELYEYMNDSHIETALRKICPKVERKY